MLTHHLPRSSYYALFLLLKNPNPFLVLLLWFQRCFNTDTRSLSDDKDHTNRTPISVASAFYWLIQITFISCDYVCSCFSLFFFFFSMSILWEALVLASTSATLHTKIMWFVSLEEGEFWIFGILFLSCFNVKHLIIWSKQRIVVYVSIGWKFESFIIQFWSKMELNGTLSICAQTHSAYTLTRIDQNL